MLPKLMFVFGTRPEAIKMVPLILKGRQDGSLDIKVCVTGQHDLMLHQVLDFFGIKPDYDLKIMRSNQTLNDVTVNILKSIEEVLTSESPSVVLVQGDTTTAMVGAMAAAYQKIPIAHIEAGLRSKNKFSPFPEELNRILVGHMADFHFAPTPKARENLLNEGLNADRIYVVGNTVIDTLFLTLNLIKYEDRYPKHFHWLEPGKRIILMTGHRRESFGKPFRNICRALKDIAVDNDIAIVYPVHLNPNVKGPVFDLLNGQKNIHLIEPLSYPYLVWLMSKSYLVITDSGGIQEEAPSLGKPVLVIRDVTERIEGIQTGTCKLVGTDRNNIVKNVTELLNDNTAYARMSNVNNPYGDGRSSQRILDVLKKEIG